MHADLTALNAQFWTAAETLTALTHAPEAPAKVTERPLPEDLRFYPVPEGCTDPTPTRVPDTKATLKAQAERIARVNREQAAKGAEQNQKMRALRLMRRVERLTAQGWTLEAALSHVEGACDQMLCTGEHA